MGNAVFLGDEACCALAGDVEEGGGIQDAVVLGVRGFDIDFEHFGEVVVEECAVVISFGVHEVEAVFFAFEPGLPVVGFVGAVGGVFESDGKGDFHCRKGHALCACRRGYRSIYTQLIPQELIVSLPGSRNPLGVVLAVVCGVPMYADIFGTIPIAEALLAKEALLGVVLSFMMAVTTLSLPSIIMLRKAVKPKLLAVFVAICVFGIIGVGYLFNALQFVLI